jgi:hypothetical protein
MAEVRTSADRLGGMAGPPGAGTSADTHQTVHFEALGRLAESISRLFSIPVLAAVPSAVHTIRAMPDDLARVRSREQEGSAKSHAKRKNNIHPRPVTEKGRIRIENNNSRTFPLAPRERHVRLSPQPVVIKGLAGARAKQLQLPSRRQAPLVSKSLIIIVMGAATIVLGAATALLVELV